MVGYEIGVLPEPITRTLDLNDDGMMKQPIEECGSDNEIAEDLAPFCEAAVRGEDHGAFLVSCIDELEEQLDKLEIGFKSAYLADAALMQEEEDEDDWVPVPVSPIKVRVLPLFL